MDFKAADYTKTRFFEVSNREIDSFKSSLKRFGDVDFRDSKKLCFIPNGIKVENGKTVYRGFVASCGDIGVCDRCRCKAENYSKEIEIVGNKRESMRYGETIFEGIWNTHKIRCIFHDEDAVDKTQSRFGILDKRIDSKIQKEVVEERKENRDSIKMYTILLISSKNEVNEKDVIDNVESILKGKHIRKVKEFRLKDHKGLVGDALAKRLRVGLDEYSMKSELDQSCNYRELVDSMLEGALDTIVIG